MLNFIDFHLQFPRSFMTRTLPLCLNKMNTNSELGLPVVCRAKVYFGQGVYVVSLGKSLLFNGTQRPYHCYFLFMFVFSSSFTQGCGGSFIMGFNYQGLLLGHVTMP